MYIGYMQTPQLFYMGLKRPWFCIWQGPDTNLLQILRTTVFLESSLPEFKFLFHHTY